MRQKLLSMLALQDQMNKKVHSEWSSQGFEWHRAIWIECAELMEHHGWKWWKKQAPDRDQVVLELIDIWHFGLSALMQQETNHATIADRLVVEMQLTPASSTFLELVEDFAGEVLNTKEFPVQKFVPLLSAMKISFDDLYRSYVGKNVLNFFRQDHGYKDGSYVKLWQGREDNEHLVELLNQLDSDSLSFQHDLYTALEMRYGQR